MSTRRKQRSDKPLPLRGKKKKDRFVVKLSQKLGNPPKMTDALLTECVELILEGLPVNKTCDYLGIPEQTFYRWRTKGEKYLRDIAEGEKPDNPDHVLYGIFVQSVVRAKAEWQLGVIRRSMQTKSKHTSLWVRDMTMLERRDRANWGRSEQIQVSDAAILPDEAYL